MFYCQIGKKSGNAYFVCATDDDPAGEYVTTRVPAWPTDLTSDAYDMALRCIEVCSVEHEHCLRPKPSKLPTRVIDCLDPAHPRLLTTDPLNLDFYVTLSYVWGENQPHRTTAENLESYQSSIDLSLIPHTIRDAINVTHRIGQRYLWVDSFCIIQDSEDEKAREISKIREYFQNAFVTLVAANADHVGAGFTPSRARWRPEPLFTLPFICPNGSVGTLQLHNSDLSKIGTSKPAEPIDSRAWCVEERLLSPRALVFYHHSLQYECRKAFVNVNGSSLWLPQQWDNSKLAKLMDGKMPDVLSWDLVLSKYRLCKVTRPQDRLVAISGVAQYFEQRLIKKEKEKEDAYVAGFWRYQLPGALLWRTGYEMQRRPVGYVAPSWSWAAADGELVAGLPRGGESICIVKHCEATPKHTFNPYGAVTSGSLILEAGVVLAVWVPSIPGSDKRGRYRWAVENASSIFLRDDVVCDPDGRYAEMYPDADEDWNATMLGSSDNRHDVTLVGVLEGPGELVRGLVLVPVRNNGTVETEVYRRIGMFEVEVDKWTLPPRQDIHII
ncbi:hypothetical protein VKT23_003721 [Stygiomarasmius scandens]|uniref:Heterokaryon incompatibility domain-containing protein n=1 Tax=Marasmiellus scandens TaxID=2682957 RepID=A0ABR1K4H5_9AGAR